MSLSLRARFLRFLLRKIFKGQHLTIEQNRARAAESARYIGRVPKGIEVEKIDIDGIRAEWLNPLAFAKEKVILYLHGGGYVGGSIETHRLICGVMAKSTRAKVLLPAYRLAPENPFPAALDDALKVYHWLLAQGYKPANIIIAGDSAGGGLSVATVLALRDAKEPLPTAIVCISPWADLTLKGQTHITKAKSEAVLTTDALREGALYYADKERLDHPLISPVYADFHGLPPMLIQVGSEEILLDDATTLAEKARADGVAVELKVWDGLWHVWHAFGNLVPESRRAFEEIGQFIFLSIPR